MYPIHVVCMPIHSASIDVYIVCKKKEKILHREIERWAAQLKRIFKRAEPSHTHTHTTHQTMKMFLLATMMVITIEIEAKTETNTHTRQKIQKYEKVDTLKRWRWGRVTRATYSIIWWRYLPIFSFHRKYVYDPWRRQHFFCSHRFQWQTKKNKAKRRAVIFLHHLCVGWSLDVFFMAIFRPQFIFFEIFLNLSKNETIFSMISNIFPSCSFLGKLIGFCRCYPVFLIHYYKMKRFIWQTFDWNIANNNSQIHERWWWRQKICGFH